MACDHPSHRHPGLLTPCPECGEVRDPDDYPLDRRRLHAEPKRTIRMPDQRSVTDQLKDLIRLAHQNGLYDAADWVMARMSVK